MTLHRYRWSSLVIESQTPLPELQTCGPATAPIRFECRTAEPRRRALTWSHQWTLPNGARWLSIARDGDAHLLRFARLADFTVTADFSHVRCDAAATTRPETIRHLLLDQVLPVIAPRGRRVGLHGSAVAIGGEAVAFLGAAGTGKSTLAAAFGLSGAPIVTDDCLMLDLSCGGIVAVPTYPSLRLRADAIAALRARVRRARRVAQYTPKLRVGAGGVAGVRFRHRPLPLDRVYVVERARAGDRPGIVPLSRRQAYMALMTFAFRLDPQDAVALRREADHLAQITHAVPVARLQVPPDLAALSEVRRAVLADARAAGARR